MEAQLREKRGLLVKSIRRLTVRGTTNVDCIVPHCSRDAGHCDGFSDGGSAKGKNKVEWDGMFHLQNLQRLKNFMIL